MQPQARSGFVQALDPSILAFEVEDIGFSLRENLEQLERVRELGANEAVVFYAARIWEAMTRFELRRFGGATESMLRNLNQFTLCCRGLPPELHRWLHQLRTLGNENRHVKRAIQSQDAEVAFAILLRWLQWYFCEYVPPERRVRTFLAFNQPLDSLLSDDLAALIERLDSAGDVDAAFLDALDLNSAKSLVLMTPILPAVLIEALIDRKRFTEAQRVLAAARKKFPRAMRLLQLEGLYHSRLGRTTKNAKELELARKILSPLCAEESVAAEETLGILGGVLKELSDLRTDDLALLRESHQTYRDGWERSLHRNNYLGINAATTALWLNDSETAVAIADRVRTNLAQVTVQLAAAEDGPRALSFWDQLTLAEAMLLAREFDEAGRCYRRAFTEFASNTGGIEVARKQAIKILDRMGESGRAAEILGV